jgi:hypothetical protein
MDSSDLVLIVDQGHLLIAYFRAPLSTIFNVVGKQSKSTHGFLKIKSVRFWQGLEEWSRNVLNTPRWIFTTHFILLIQQDLGDQRGINFIPILSTPIFIQPHLGNLHTAISKFDLY